MAKHRDRRDHRSEWSDERPDDFQEPSFFRQQRAVSPGRPAVSRGSGVDAVVLWFNADKGFGFVQTPDGGKAFLHARQLEAAGYSTVVDGANIKVVLEAGDKGPQVSSVLEVGTVSVVEPARRPAPRNDVATGEGAGTVKFYNADKGFGFIGLAAGGKDVFVHASTLSRSGLTTLEQEQLVKVSYAQGAKGLKARTVWLD